MFLMRSEFWLVGKDPFAFAVHSIVNISLLYKHPVSAVRVIQKRTACPHLQAVCQTVFVLRAAARQPRLHASHICDAGVATER